MKALQRVSTTATNNLDVVIFTVASEVNVILICLFNEKSAPNVHRRLAGKNVAFPPNVDFAVDYDKFIIKIKTNK